VASSGPYANLHLDPDTQPRQHPTIQFFYRPGALPATQPTALKHWWQSHSLSREIQFACILQWIKKFLILQNECTTTYHRFMAPWIVSGTTRVSRHQKVKPKLTNLDLLEQETVGSNGISWAICKSASRPRQITMPVSHHSVFTGQMPFLTPNQQR